jgi:hypothetical protein
LKIKETAKRKNKLREKYDVPIPSDKELFKQIARVNLLERRDVHKLVLERALERAS